jgi:hypothetical protein
MASLDYVSWILALIILYIVKVIAFDRRRKAPPPPGPKGLPFIGNVQDLPPPDQPIWLHWLKLKDKYGRGSLSGSSLIALYINTCRKALSALLPSLVGPSSLSMIQKRLLTLWKSDLRTTPLGQEWYLRLKCVLPPNFASSHPTDRVLGVAGNTRWGSCRTAIVFELLVNICTQFSGQKRRYPSFIHCKKQRCGAFCYVQ